jgi:hypothetical protein
MVETCRIPINNGIKHDKTYKTPINWWILLAHPQYDGGDQPSAFDSPEPATVGHLGQSKSHPLW